MASTVFACERWVGGYWQVVEGGLTREAALKMARELTREGERCSVAEYPTEEGASAIGRAEVE